MKSAVTVALRIRVISIRRQRVIGRWPFYYITSTSGTFFLSPGQKQAEADGSRLTLRHGRSL